MTRRRLVIAWYNWLLATAFVVIVFGMQSSYAVTSVSLADDLSLSLTQIGLVSSVYTWVFALTQFVSGTLLDRLGSRIITVAAILLGLGGLLFASASSFSMLLLAQMIIALAASFGFVGAGFVGGQWFSPIKYGLMFSLVQFVASSMAIVTQQSFNILILDYTWSELVRGIAWVSLALGGIMIFSFRDPTSLKLPRASLRFFYQLLHDVADSMTHIAANRDAWINCLIGGASFGAMLAIGVLWGPRILVANGVEVANANSLASFSWLGIALGSPLLALASDRFKSRRLPLKVSLAVQLVTISVLIFAVPSSPLMIGFVFFVWGFSAGGSMISFSIAADLVSKEYIGASAALVNGTQFILAGVLISLPANVLSKAPATASDYNSEALQLALLIYPVILFLAMLLLRFLKESYPAERAQQ